MMDTLINTIMKRKQELIGVIIPDPIFPRTSSQVHSVPRMARAGGK